MSPDAFMPDPADGTVASTGRWTAPLYGFDRNARAVVLTEGLWALFGTAALYYLTFYMSSLGLSAIEIGWIVSLGLYASGFCQLIAGAITDRWGRRWTTTVFDSISWVLPMLIWALSQSFWGFLVGFLLNSTSKIVGVSFGLLAAEDTPASYRPKVFAAVKLVALLAGLTVPVVGLCIERWGPVPTLRVLFLLGCVSMLIHNLVRHRMTRETRAGVAAMREHRNIALHVGARRTVSTFLAACSHRSLWRVVAVYVATSLAFQINIFQALYMTEELQLDARWVGAFPAIGAVVSLACYLFLIPLAERRWSSARSTVVSLILACIGWLSFVMLQERASMLPLLFTAALIAAGPFLLESYRDAVVIDSVVAEDRSAFFAAVQSLAAVVTVPAGVVAGYLYEQSPRSLFIGILSLYAIALMCALAPSFGTTSGTALLHPRREHPGRDGG